MGKQALRVVRWVTAGAATIALGACSSGKTSSGGTTVTDNGYDTSCSSDNDCVGVYFGDVCGFCSTVNVNAAINSSSEGAYQNAVNAAYSQCPPSMINGSCAESSTITTCSSAGKCTVTACPGAVAGPHQCGPTSVEDPGLSKACNTDSDCITVYFGQLCGFCPPWDNAAIAASAEGAYQAAYNNAQAGCPPQNGGGSCAAEGSVGISVCAGGMCQFQTCVGVTGMPADNLHACPSDGGVGDAGGPG